MTIPTPPPTVLPTSRDPTLAEADVVVVGTGFGGLGAALRLAEEGARVVVLERMSYPGGCASTFSRAGYRFEAGATLFSGFDPGQLFQCWIERHGLDVTIDRLDPVVEFRTPDLELAVPDTREEFVRRLSRLPGAPADAVRSFFERQHEVSDVLWGLLDDPALLPPFGPGGLLGHVRRLPRYLPLLRLVGKPLDAVLTDHGLGECAPLRTFLDAMCQITIQCGVAEAEAPFALGTLDYYFRGTGHVRGGIGVLANALVGAIRGLGGDVRFADDVRGLHRDGDAWRVTSRRGEFRAPQVVLNLLPQNVRALLGDAASGARGLERVAERVEDGWGACMLYLVMRPPDAGADAPHHLQIVQDPGAPSIEGNHLFCSVSGPHDGDRAPRGLRTMTVSTHVPMRRLRGLDDAARAAYVRGIQERMKAGLRRLAPGWMEEVVHEMTASPRTFERFTGRFLGHVGGIPRRAGLHHYTTLGPRPIVPGVWMVGDSIFPGQSTLAAALGGVKTAEAVLRRARPAASL